MAEPMNHDVAVVIVTYNNEGDIFECISSLQASSDTIIDLLVIDNASQDATREVIRNSFPRVQVISKSANTGFASASNEGARRSSSSYLVFLNPDTESARNWIERSILLMKGAQR